MMAEMGIEKACRKSEALYKGVNIYNGKCVYRNVALAFGIEYSELKNLVR